jgi:hypothetical protein
MPKINEGDYHAGSQSQTYCPTGPTAFTTAWLRENGQLEVSFQPQEVEGYFARMRESLLRMGDTVPPNFNADFLKAIPPEVSFNPKGAKITRSEKLVGPDFPYGIGHGGDTLYQTTTFQVTYVRPRGSKAEIPVFFSESYCQYVLDVSENQLRNRPKQVRTPVAGSSSPVVV